MSDYAVTRDRVEHYFDRTATRTWERLTSDAKVSRIRQTVREGRDRMRAEMLALLPADLTGRRVLDAGCGTGAMTEELARRGAQVTAVDISPQLVTIARERLPAALAAQVRFHSGDMTDTALGSFDHVMAMDSLIYYRATDIAQVLHQLGSRTTGSIVFTVAPRTPLLLAMWSAGKLFPRSDRSPTMVSQDFRQLAALTRGNLRQQARVHRGFYISDCLEYRP
jgi:magnesium-protoporphyrin O-methyltransferase